MKKWEFELVSSNTYIDGANLVRENSFKYHNSSLVQRVSLKLGGDMVTFDTSVDWHEELKMLRADFVPTVFADSVKCNIQFGNLTARQAKPTRTKITIRIGRNLKCARINLSTLTARTTALPFSTTASTDTEQRKDFCLWHCCALLYSPTRRATEARTRSAMRYIRTSRNLKRPTLWQRDIFSTILSR